MIPCFNDINVLIKSSARFQRFHLLQMMVPQSIQDNVKEWTIAADVELRTNKTKPVIAIYWNLKLVLFADVNTEWVQLISDIHCEP